MYPYLCIKDEVMLAGQIEANEEAHTHSWALGMSLSFDDKPRPTDRLWKWSELQQGPIPFNRNADCPAEDAQHRLDLFHGPVPANAIWNLLDTPVNEPLSLVTHLEFANIISGMAPHDIVYTIHVPCSPRQEPATISRQQYNEGLKFYGEVAEAKEAEVQQLMLIARKERAFNQHEKDKLASASQQLSADLFLALQYATDTNLEMEGLKATIDRYQLDTSRMQRIQYKKVRIVCKPLRQPVRQGPPIVWQTRREILWIEQGS